jgi:hypothetical protein
LYLARPEIIPVGFTDLFLWNICPETPSGLVRALQVPFLGSCRPIRVGLLSRIWCTPRLIPRDVEAPDMTTQDWKLEWIRNSSSRMEHMVISI